MGSIAMLRDWPFSAFIGPQNTGGMVSGSVASSVERLLGRRNHREREPPMESKRQRSFDGSGVIERRGFASNGSLICRERGASCCCS